MHIQLSVLGSLHFGFEGVNMYKSSIDKFLKNQLLGLFVTVFTDS